MNHQPRIDRFATAIDRYGDPANSDSETIIDLLADAMHWCDAHGEDFHICLAMACRHYINELNDDQQDERRMEP